MVETGCLGLVELCSVALYKLLDTCKNEGSGSLQTRSYKQKHRAAKRSPWSEEP